VLLNVVLSKKLNTVLGIELVKSLAKFIEYYAFFLFAQVEDYFGDHFF
jgi:hypothetical protein